ncbi:unnamed protein product [Paramecium octaurelia]|uniref:Uncharacterized protein n=1 Tax=Paramecium octaurelia TaxID=43137 RepID=A0A8S1SAJ2_PAROT|nr:unnamed protein product [Paramecium octaurelia]
MLIKIGQVFYRVLIALNASTILFSGIWLTFLFFKKGELTLFNLQGPLKQNILIKEQFGFVSNDFGKSCMLFILSSYYHRCYKDLQFSYMISQFYNYLFLFYSLCFLISYIGKSCIRRKSNTSKEDLKSES